MNLQNVGGPLPVMPPVPAAPPPVAQPQPPAAPAADPVHHCGDASHVVGEIQPPGGAPPLGGPGGAAQSDADFIKDAFRTLLCREADDATVMSASMALANGHPREDFIKGIMESQERKNAESLGFTGIQKELPGLQTVPADPKYAGVKLPMTNLPEMVMQALREAKAMNPDVLAQAEKLGDTKNVKKEKEFAYKLMTDTIGILRANGIDASRVVAFGDEAVGSPGRYAFDQLRIGDGPAIDIMGGDEGVTFLEQEAWSRRENAPAEQRWLTE